MAAPTISSTGGPDVGKLPEGGFAIPKGINKRCDLPPEAYIQDFKEQDQRFVKRPAFSQTGKNVKIQVNQFPVTKFTNVDVNQFDVALSPQPLKEIVFKKVWASKPVQDVLAKLPPFLHDGAALAWSTAKDEFRLKVDLDLENGGKSRGTNVFHLTVRPSKKIRMEILRAYLGGKTSWSEPVLECMNFLDHLLRQGPSERFKLIKRSLFNESSETKRLDANTEAVKGIYAAVRMSENIHRNGGLGLGINVDVSNQTFFVGQKLEQVMRNFLNALNVKWSNNQFDSYRTLLQPVKTSNPQRFAPCEAFKALRRLHKLKFVITHREDEGRVYTIHEFHFDEKVAEGANARNTKFKLKETGKETTISDYYQQKYKAQVQYWWLPLVKTSRGGLFPVETCRVTRLNRYPFKLDALQTSDMIKFAVQRPPQRKTEIMKCVANLGWANDKYLRAFGMVISPHMAVVEARELPNPIIEFKGLKKVDPRNTGRWDLRGSSFYQSNPKPLAHWAFCVMDGCVDLPVIQAFVKTFIQTYKTHGGQIAAQPQFINCSTSTGPLAVVRDAFNRTGNTTKGTPQILFFILKDKGARTYECLKKCAECDFGMPTQMLQASHVRKAQPQYCSNVCMKVNAKLGGVTSRIFNAPAYKVPTCMIGVDVSHAAPGVKQTSLASMCLSLDKDTTYYLGSVQTNGWRVEILQPQNVHLMLGPMLRVWLKKHKTAPKEVFYFRDGVSEGQFAQVLDWELPELRRAFKNCFGEAPKFTVIVATKRHHIRFFPEKGDKNGNVYPGTLADREVTHPFHYDFYLCSHSAIQGTARPVHYNVIHDEIRMRPDDLQRMIYTQCYQYMRSTTPVSLHPAVYYAHLAGNRARGHEVDVAQQGAGAPTAGKHTVSSAKKINDVAPRLAKLGGTQGIAHKDCIERFPECMWFI
ncbi:hypothetical protein OQA88_9815 [Cercophora sp. LCS_1]